MAVKKDKVDTRRKKAPPIEEPAIFYFLRRVERAEDRHLVESFLQEFQTHHTVPFELVDHFVRRLRQQNIFIFIQGASGKPESLLLTKVMFSMNKIIRIYNSLSMREEDYNFLRIYPNERTGKITVERVSERNKRPQLVYEHRDQCHIIRFITNWIVARMDWKKTKLRNLDIYKYFIEVRQRQLEQKLKELNEARDMGRMGQLMGGASRADQPPAQASR